ncbi:PH domain-containing protein [Thermococcus sp.]|uniref:PH domain-containing protein n=1 Tax=Thermococcus sp. TaxID=35749 RepID=UPI0026032EA6|nr:PH domain-containing protein [Thermococcus sp.]
MGLDDYLLPKEEVKFQSKNNVQYGGKNYQVIVTDRRIILYARRGAIFKSDDVVTFKLSDVEGIKYKEEGLIGKRGIIEIQGKTKAKLMGSTSEMKTLYQQLLQFL